MSDLKEVTTIIVRFEDEITTLLDKLEEVGSQRVVISIPQGSDLLLSGVSMKVLVRKVLGLNKIAILVTDDEIGGKLSEDAGFLVKSSTKEISDADWDQAKENLKTEKELQMDKRKPAEEPSDTSKTSLNPLPTQDNLEQVDLMAVSDEVVSETGDNDDVSIVASSSNSSIEESPLKNDSKIEEPMDLGRDRPGNNLEKSKQSIEIETSNIRQVSSGDFEMTIDSSPIKKGSTQVSNSDIEKSVDTNIQQNNLSENLLETTQDLDSNRNLIGRDFSKFKPVGKLDTSVDSLPGEEIKTDRTRNKGKSLIDKIKPLLQKLSPMKIFKSSVFKVFMVLMLILVALAGAYSVFLLPEVVVRLKIESIPVDFEGDVLAEVSLESMDFENLKIRAKEGLVEKNTSDTTAATGSETRGESSSGVVTIYNNKEEAVILPTGTLLSNEGLTFVLDSEVTVPEKPDAVGMGSVGANVSASDIGSEYNLEAGSTFSIGNYALSDLKATNASSFSGGSKEDFTVVNQSDIDDLANTLKEELFQESENEIKELYDDDWVLVEESLESQIKGDVSSDVLAGTEADTVNVSVEVESKALFYSKEDLDDLIELLLIGELDQDDVENLELSEDISKSINISASSLEDGSVSLNIKISGFVMAELDSSGVVDDLISKNWAEGLKLLNDVDFLAEDPEFEYYPEWMPELFWRWPSDKNRIIIKIQNVEPDSELEEDDNSQQDSSENVEPE